MTGAYLTEQCALSSHVGTAQQHNTRQAATEPSVVRNVVGLSAARSRMCHIQTSYPVEQTGMSQLSHIKHGCFIIHSVNQLWLAHWLSHGIVGSGQTNKAVQLRQKRCLLMSKVATKSHSDRRVPQSKITIELLLQTAQQILHDLCLELLCNHTTTAFNQHALASASGFWRLATKGDQYRLCALQCESHN